MEETFYINERGRVAERDVSSDDRTIAILLHLSIFAYIIIPIPVVIPLVLWLITRDRSPYLDDHGREAVNFHLSLTIYTIITVALTVITCGLAGLIIVPLSLVIVVLGIVGAILGAIAAAQNEYFRYPATLRLLHGPGASDS